MRRPRRVGAAPCGSGLLAAEQQVEHGHPDRDSVGDLFDDHRARSSRRRRRRSPCRGSSGRGASRSRGRAAAPPEAVEPVAAGVLARTGEERRTFIRSRWTRSIITASLLGSAASRSYDVATGQVVDPDRQQGRRRDQCDLGAERDSSSTLDRATRLCRTSPTIVTRAAVERRRGRARIVNASSSAWVGCSWVPSPAFTTRPRIQPAVASRCGAPEAPCRIDHGVGAHRLQGQRGVLEALALGHARPLGREVDHVRGQPLGGGLERDPGAGGVLEEQVDDRPAAQRRAAS